jgi:hypothetical protein
VTGTLALHPRGKPENKGWFAEKLTESGGVTEPILAESAKNPTLAEVKSDFSNMIHAGINSGIPRAKRQFYEQGLHEVLANLSPAMLDIVVKRVESIKVYESTQRLT